MLATADKAREVCERPVWIRGIDHRIDIHQPGFRDLTVSKSAALAAKNAGVGDAPVEFAELCATFSLEEKILREALGLDDGVDVNPSGGALAGEPDDGGRAHPHRRGGPPDRRGAAASEGVAHATSGLVRCSRTSSACWRGTDVSHQPCAVIGVGQTKHKKRRDDLSLPGLVREAAQRALDDAELDWTDIDAVVLGKAPDPFEGVMMPELSMADALGRQRQADAARAHRRERRRLDVARRRRTSSQTGRHDRVLDGRVREAVRGQRPVGPRRRAQRRHGRGRHLRPVDAVVHRSVSGAPEHIGWKVAVKDRRNAAKNPYAHLQMPNLTIEEVKDSPMLWDPIHFHESCPSSDGACAMVLTNEAGAAKALVAPPAWISAPRCAASSACSPAATRCAHRPASSARHAVYDIAGHHQPA